ncbi:helix-turn-helix domain-containing protein [Streptomyces sp. NPDC014793]|uniref:helix-turn-helix domain-containing protein n=1 Tax=Streptomyces sp. NPDC014793 TaxID=3364914 RepID=UPI0037008E14
MTETSPRDYQRLAQLARTRRAELRLAITEVAAAAGMSKDTYRRVESGARVWDSKYAQIDEALGWEIGSCLSILAGGDPKLVGVEQTAEKITVTSIDPEDFDHAFVSALIATKGDLTGNEIRELSDRVTAELKRRGIL